MIIAQTAAVRAKPRHRAANSQRSQPRQADCRIAFIAFYFAAGYPEYCTSYLLPARIVPPPPVHRSPSGTE